MIAPEMRLVLAAITGGSFYYLYRSMDHKHKTRKRTHESLLSLPFDVGMHREAMTPDYESDTQQRHYEARENLPGDHVQQYSDGTDLTQLVNEVLSREKEYTHVTYRTNITLGEEPLYVSQNLYDVINRAY